MHRSLSLALLFALTIVFTSSLTGWAGEASPAPSASQPAAGAPAAAAAPGPAMPAPAPAAPGPARPAPAPAETPSVITSVQVSGNNHIAREEILGAISSKAGQVYSEAQVARDRDAVFARGWFVTVSVERAVTESGIALTFKVVEQPIISGIQFEGNTVISRADLLGVMQTKMGQVANNNVLREDRKRIMALYNSRFYMLAAVLGSSMSEAGVLTIGIAEGVIEAIRVTGNTRTKDKVIRRYIRTKPGDVYNDKRVAADVNRLSAMRWFDSVQRSAEMGSEPGKVILSITVVERKHTGQATLGGGYSSVQGLVGFVDWTMENLKGTGQAVTARGEFGGQSSYELYYRNPWIMTPETRLNLGLYDRLVVREAFVKNTEGAQQTVLYHEHRAGGSVTLGRPLSDRTIVYLGARDDRISLADLSAEEAAILTGPAFQPSDVRSLTAALATDTRDNRDYPRHGAFYQLSSEFAGLLGGSSDFDKFSGDVRRYLPLGKKNTFAMRLLLGTITGSPPYLEEFMIGGTESLRGYPTDEFVGDHLALLNTELRVPMGKNLIAVAFVDVGDAWGGPVANDPLIQGDATFTAHVGYGLGVRVKTPIGPLRLDIGFGPEGTQTHFGIAQMF